MSAASPTEKATQGVAPRHEHREAVPPGVDLRFALLFSGIAFAAFVVGVYLYANFGGPFVDQLDEQVGEVVAVHARNLEGAGLTGDAILHYRQALAAPFDDPYQWSLTAIRLTDLLLRERLFEEAIETATAIRQRYPEEWRSYDQLFDAYFGLGRFAEAEVAATEWLALAEREANAQQAEWARNAIAKAAGKRR